MKRTRYIPADQNSPFILDYGFLKSKTKVCEKVFDQITGIVQEDKTNATVEFIWKYDNFQPIYEIVKPALELEQPTPINVRMRKYDDGWRLEK